MYIYPCIIMMMWSRVFFLNVAFKCLFICLSQPSLKKLFSISSFLILVSFLKRYFFCFSVNLFYMFLYWIFLNITLTLNRRRGIKNIFFVRILWRVLKEEWFEKKNCTTKKLLNFKVNEPHCRVLVVAEWRAFDLLSNL